MYVITRLSSAVAGIAALLISLLISRVLQDGLIDRAGHYLLPPQYIVYEYDYLYIIIHINESGEWLYGYFDKDSGFLLMPEYEHISDTYPTMNRQIRSSFIGAKRDGKYGFLCRETGNVALPFVYDDIMAKFCAGYALVCTSDQWTLIDVEGTPVRFTEGIHPVSGATPNGAVIVTKSPTTEEETRHALWGALYGLARTDGTLILPPCYGDIDYILKDGTAAFCTGDGKWGVLDERGAVVVAPQYASESALIQAGLLLDDAQDNIDEIDKTPVYE